MLILDCTLRDGGYYTGWDFSTKVVEEYIDAMNNLPIDYLELGYRNNPTDEYLGKFGYCPVSVLQQIRASSNKKLAVMLNEKSTSTADLERLIKPLIGIVDMIRLAVDPKNMERATGLAREVKKMGFEVAFNVMYMSKWGTYPDVYKSLKETHGVIDILNMVDSFGGITPDEVISIVAMLRKNISCKIGFHGHNNLQLGLINTLTAIKCGVDSVDSTILGMGRGAGNLNTELLLTYLNKHNGLPVDFNELGNAIMAFTPLYEKYRWGTNLPYMISGANSFPQKEVMELVNNRVYSFNSVVRSLDNRIDSKEDNQKYPVLTTRKMYSKVIVVGGGNTVEDHIDAIKEFLASNPNTAVILSTSRHARLFLGLDQDIYYCLVGNEGHRLTSTVGAKAFRGVCVLPPYPRKMGTEVPSYAQKDTVELDSISFVDDYKDSVTAVSLQLALNLSDGDVYVVGYDGYPGNVLSEKEVTLTQENNMIFKGFEKAFGRRLISLTPTIYRTLSVRSIYQLLSSNV